jgi:hypothetical protein
MARKKVSLPETELADHRSLVALLEPLVAHSIEHYYLCCHVLKNLLLQLGLGTPVLPW